MRIGHLLCVMLVSMIAPQIVRAVVPGPMTATVAEPSRALYLQQIETYPSPALRAVSSKEYKLLIDPALTRSSAPAVFSDLWTKLRAAAASQGFEVTERKKNPLAIEKSTREYFDTRDGALWRKGYLIRVTDRRHDGGTPVAPVVTVKSIADDPIRTLAAPLSVVGAGKVMIAAEDNVSFLSNGALGGYIEKGVTFSAALPSSDDMMLGDFGRYVPGLLDLGLSADSILTGSKVFSDRVRPGKVSLPGVGAANISIEAWSVAAGGAPFLYEVSFGYGDVDFYAAGETHAAAERFMVGVIGDLRHLSGPDGARWAGSKIRKLMNRPVVPQ